MDIESHLRLMIAEDSSTVIGAEFAKVAIDKFNELRAENARLQAIIDEANAQEPVSNVHVFYDTSDYESGVDRRLTWDTFGSNFKSLGIGKHKLYARPIPAQQSPAVAVPEPTGALTRINAGLPPLGVRMKPHLAGDESIHFMDCNYCGKPFDMRDFSAVMFHEGDCLKS